MPVTGGTQGIEAFGTRHGGKQHARILGFAAHGPFDVEGREAEGPALIGHRARRRAYAGDAIEGSRRAEAAREIGPHGQRHESRRECHSRAPGGPRSGIAHVMRIAGGAPQRIGARRAESEFRNVGLADDDRALPLQMRHDEFIRGGDVVLVEVGAVGGRQTLDIVHVLDADGQAMQRRKFLSPHDGLFRRPRLRQRLFRPHVAEGDEERVQSLDSREAMPHQLDGRQLSRADQATEFGGGKLVNLVHGKHYIRGSCDIVDC